MKKTTIFLALALSFGLFSACSSDDELVRDGDTTQVEDNIEWESLSLNMGVPEGSLADGNAFNTKAMGDLDPETELPRASYPNALPVYLCLYDSNTGTVAESLKIREENASSSSTVKYQYHLNTADNQVLMKSPSDKDEDAIKVGIKEYQEGMVTSDGADLFFFASHNEIKDIQFPNLDASEVWGPYGTESCKEFGDKLFSTDGYFFQWNDAEHSRAGLYLVVRNDYKGNEVKEIKEIDNWQDAEWDLNMKRMTACVSIRLMLIDHYNSEGTIENIAGIEQNTDFIDARNFTNKAVQDYIAAHSELEQQYPGITAGMEGFNVENIFVLKKALEDFPCIYDWANGLQSSNAAARKDLLLCNLDFPAWVDAMTFYEHGSSKIRALTATCDNEPFIPADGTFIPRVDLALYMGIGQRDPSDTENGGTFGNVARYVIPFGDTTTGSNSYHVTPNTHTYIYVGLTLENIVELYRYLVLNRQTKSSTAEIPTITLSPNQIQTVVEPYYSTPQ